MIMVLRDHIRMFRKRFFQLTAYQLVSHCTQMLLPLLISLEVPVRGACKFTHKIKVQVSKIAPECFYH